jgi:uncharacterized membrane protein
MLPPEVLIVVRWFHFLAGITWIGLLFWFSLVNVNFMKTLDATTRPVVVPQLLTRALFWFRHSSWVTVLIGFVLIYGLYWQTGRADLVRDDGFKTIFSGMLLGLAMLFNVWFVVWPSQRRLLAAMAAGTPPDPAWARNTLYASRANAAMSFPLLFFMGAASHFPLDWPQIALVAVVAAGIGLAAVLYVQEWAAARF